jgi:hypothetical protein
VQEYRGVSLFPVDREQEIRFVPPLCPFSILFFRNILPVSDRWSSHLLNARNAERAVLEMQYAFDQVVEQRKGVEQQIREHNGVVGQKQSVRLLPLHLPTLVKLQACPRGLADRVTMMYTFHRTLIDSAKLSARPKSSFKTPSTQVETKSPPISTLFEELLLYVSSFSASSPLLPFSRTTLT